MDCLKFKHLTKRNLHTSTCIVYVTCVLFIFIYVDDELCVLKSKQMFCSDSVFTRSFKEISYDTFAIHVIMKMVSNDNATLIKYNSDKAPNVHINIKRHEDRPSVHHYLAPVFQT